MLVNPPPKRHGQRGYNKNTRVRFILQVTTISFTWSHNIKHFLFEVNLAFPMTPITTSWDLFTGSNIECESDVVNCQVLNGQSAHFCDLAYNIDGKHKKLWRLQSFTLIYAHSLTTAQFNLHLFKAQSVNQSWFDFPFWDFF